MTNEVTAAEIAQRVGGSVEGDPGRTLRGLAAVDGAGPDDLTIVLDSGWARQLPRSAAGAALVPVTLAVEETDATLIRVENPRLALALIAPLLVPPDETPSGVSPLAEVHPEAQLGPGVSIGPFVVVGSGAVIGESTRIDALTLVGAGAVIGRDCWIESSCTVGGGVRMGDRVRLQPGVRLGTDGFGFTAGPAGLVKVPQVGRCVIGDDVEIGANSTVDRGALGDTVIGDGTKIDSLVIIAHNVRLGRQCVIAGQSGIAGSVRIGDGVTLGGGVGIKDHVTIGDGARIGARSGVSCDIPPGTEYFGYPARPRHEALRAAAALYRLPRLFRRLRELEKAASDESE